MTYDHVDTLYTVISFCWEKDTIKEMNSIYKNLHHFSIFMPVNSIYENLHFFEYFLCLYYKKLSKLEEDQSLN